VDVRGPQHVLHHFNRVVARIEQGDHRPGRT
jgi:hypothetical protein